MLIAEFIAHRLQVPVEEVREAFDAVRLFKWYPEGERAAGKKPKPRWAWVMVNELTKDQLELLKTGRGWFVENDKNDTNRGLRYVKKTNSATRFSLVFNYVKAKKEEGGGNDKNASSA